MTPFPRRLLSTVCTWTVCLWAVLTARGEPIDFEKGRQFWSFQPVVRPALPRVGDRSRVQSPIDHFVLVRLENKGLEPVEAADKRTLLRRATFDLVGLPPTPADVEAFLSDPAPDAFSRVVDRLLASPLHGQRWARYWLDLARYAEEQKGSVAYKPLRYAYKYRDWVVGAFNDDLSFDQFVIRQIAGDLVAGLGEEGRTAVGYFALGPIYKSDAGGDESKLRNRYETIDDKMDTMARGFLGLTVACARCHDHKFDPIPTEDYYWLAGVFYNTKHVSRFWLASKDEIERYEKAESSVKSQERLLKSAKRERKSRDAIGKLVEELDLIAGLDTPVDRRGVTRVKESRRLSELLAPARHFGAGE